MLFIGICVVVHTSTGMRLWVCVHMRVRTHTCVPKKTYMQQQEPDGGLNLHPDRGPFDRIVKEPIVRIANDGAA